ncbi:TPA: hypothetical protein PXO68_003160 [Yersinia enterocolitica]|uniref:hypothetical protein n=1 Tax=Yersinia enterocolitica TaxID=630 RepID=UPI002A0E0EC2|nr:hypothetical protein [Yersinia enterocolitica]EKN6091050.1 hypothetical protein [Yersinia enterocolitica]ELY5242013.1 hypothetical protein [Yersinia enterocolitica]HDL7601568.1 hypothetical protein [Yersinia enterocolitica]HDL7609407.1 hypothetical protein [Yersinia enterocolitica]
MSINNKDIELLKLILINRDKDIIKMKRNIKNHEKIRGNIKISLAAFIIIFIGGFIIGFKGFTLFILIALGVSIPIHLYQLKKHTTSPEALNISSLNDEMIADISKSGSKELKDELHKLVVAHGYITYSGISGILNENNKEENKQRLSELINNVGSQVILKP